MIRRQLLTLGRRQIGQRPLIALSTASSSRPAPPTPSSTFNVVRHLSSTTDVAHSPPSSPTARVSKDGVVGEPIDFDVGSKIEGNESQVSEVRLYYTGKVNAPARLVRFHQLVLPGEFHFFFCCRLSLLLSSLASSFVPNPVL
jgi:hypothetical protein